MKKKIIAAFAAITLVIMGCFMFFNNQKKDNNDIMVNATIDLNLDCGSAYLVEKSTQKVLYKQNELAKMHPASMTKMMGLILVCEAIDNNQIKLDDVVNISSKAASMGGSQVFLQPLELMSVSDLLKCVCIASANDAMYALSEYVGSTNENFIKMMNQKVKELNLSNTNFVNVTGFDDDNHYTCAKDMALIALELLKYEDLILPFTSMYDSYIRNDSANPFWLVNTNKMIKYYSGMDGLKTGYTSKAGFCLTATAKRNDIRLVSVIMNSKSSAKRNEMTKTLLDYGFSKVKSKKLYSSNSLIASIKLSKAKDEKIELYCQEDINLIYEGNYDKTLLEKKIVLNENLMAPIKKDSVIGYLIIKYDNDEYKYPLIVLKDIESISIMELIGQYLKELLF